MLFEILKNKRKLVRKRATISACLAGRSIDAAGMRMR